MRADQINRLHFKGKWLEARPELVRDLEVVTELLSRIQAASPRNARFIPVWKRPFWEPSTPRVATSIAVLKAVAAVPVTCMRSPEIHRLGVVAVRHSV
jgi:hypothetical protein